MYTLIIGFTVGIILMIYSKQEHGFEFFISFLISAIIAGSISNEHTIQKDIEYLEVLQDGSTTSGSFFLGSGSIGEDFKYHFYTKEKDGSFRLKSLTAEGVIIKYSDGKPRIETIKDIQKFWSWAFDFPIDKKVIIYIPEGSIRNGYTLDAQ